MPTEPQHPPQTLKPGIRAAWYFAWWMASTDVSSRAAWLHCWPRMVAWMNGPEPPPEPSPEPDPRPQPPPDPPPVPVLPFDGTWMLAVMDWCASQDSSAWWSSWSLARSDLAGWLTSGPFAS